MTDHDPMLDGITRCHICGDEITDWGFGAWHHVTGVSTPFRGHDHDAVGNTTGWFDSRDVWHDGHAVTHTESTTDAGPNYCRECSEARGHWVRWPCSATSARSE
jgi:hypothetical protein